MKGSVTIASSGTLGMGTVCALILWSSPLRAADPQTAATQSVELAEVLVTATKREARAQDIPLSIAVIGNDEISKRGLINQEDYLRAIPGVNEVNRGGWDSAIVVRGIAAQLEQQTSPNSSGSTVASYFDETPITGAGGMGAGGFDVRPVDIERIEVLRGPQGTTFGAASLSGATRVIPMKPQLDAFGAKIVGSFSSTSGAGSENAMVQGVVNLPLVQDKFALRAVGYRFDESGFYRNVAGSNAAMLAYANTYGLGSFVSGFTQDDVGQMISTGGRIAALWRVTDKLDFSFHFLRQEMEQNGYPAADTAPYEQVRLPAAPDLRLRGQPGEAGDLEMDLASLTMNYDLGWAGLTAVASSVDSSSQFTLTRVASGPPGTIFYPSTYKTFTAETRLASKLSGPLQFLVGLYYQKLEETTNTAIYWPGTAETNPFRTADPREIVFDIRRDNDESAAFAEVSYNITEKLTATAGGRYYKYDKSQYSLREGPLVGIPIGTGNAPTLDSSDNGTTFKGNLNYKLTPDSMVYASWSEGFRLGRPLLGVPSLICDPNGDGIIDGSSTSVASTQKIDSDTLENYELGGKFSLFGRRVTVDTSVYHIKWDGLPVQNTVIVAGTPCAYFANGGSATSEGVDVQASVAAARGLRLDFGVGYTQPEFSRDVPTQGWRKGDRLPGSPKVNANFAAQYDFVIAGYNAFVRADSMYSGEFYGDVQRTAALRVDDYYKIDARAGMTFSSLGVEVFVRNVTNKDAFTFRGSTVGTLGPTAAYPSFGYQLRPRTVGLQLSYSFE